MSFKVPKIFLSIAKESGFLTISKIQIRVCADGGCRYLIHRHPARRGTGTRFPEGRGPGALDFARRMDPRVERLVARGGQAVLPGAGDEGDARGDDFFTHFRTLSFPTT